MQTTILILIIIYLVYKYLISLNDITDLKTDFYIEKYRADILRQQKADLQEWKTQFLAHEIKKRNQERDREKENIKNSNLKKDKIKDKTGKNYKTS